MNNIKKAHIEKGMGQKEVAIALGVSQPTVSEWESDKKNPIAKHLKQLSEILDVTIDYLLGSNNTSIPSNIMNNRLRQLRIKKDCSQQEVATILGVSRQVYNNYELGKREPNYQMLKK